MSSSITVKPVVNRLINFMTEIEEGKFKIPTFQRDFVWEKSDKIQLFDSIGKEYPIGSILLWKPDATFEYKEEIGPYFISNFKKSDFFYILDGFQRLSTLFGCLHNPEKTSLYYDVIRQKKEFSMFFDLEDETFNMNNLTKITNIPVYVLIDTYAFLDHLDLLRSEISDKEKAKLLVERAKKISSTLIDYSIPAIQILGGSIKEAVEIFSRINSKGKLISQDWMLSALTSSEHYNFNLGNILTGLLLDLEEYNFGTIKRDILVQCIQTSYGKIYFDQKVEDLPKKADFKDVTYKTIESIKKAINFLFEELLVIDKKLLPYNNQLIFISYFFNETDKPTAKQIEKLKDWFWKTTYSNYFTIYSLSKIRLAFEQFKLFINDEDEETIYYERNGQKFTIADLPNNVSTKSVRSTAMLLFLLNHSNEFKSIDHKDVEALRITYLYKGNTSHAGIVPLVKYTNTSEKQLPFNFYKSDEMVCLFYDYKFISFCNDYFLNQNMEKWENEGNRDRVLEERINLIKKNERIFVNNLGIEYI